MVNVTARVYVGETASRDKMHHHGAGKPLFVQARQANDDRERVSSGTCSNEGSSAVR